MTVHEQRSVICVKCSMCFPGVKMTNCSEISFLNSCFNKALEWGVFLNANFKRMVMESIVGSMVLTVSFAIVDLCTVHLLCTLPRFLPSFACDWLLKTLNNSISSGLGLTGPIAT